MNSFDETKDRAVVDALDAFDRFHERIVALHAPAIAELSLTVAQLKAVYLTAAAGPLRMGALSTRLGTALSTTSGVVDRLVQMGLIERAEDSADRRQVLVHATGKAVALLEDMSELGRGRMRELLMQIDDPNDIHTVERAVRLLTAAAARISKDTPS